jgi:YD repeat-containing protein
VSSSGHWTISARPTTTQAGSSPSAPTRDQITRQASNLAGGVSDTATILAPAAVVPVTNARQHPRRVTPAAPDLQQLCGRQHYGSAKVPFRIDDSNCLVINRLLRVARLLLLGGYDGVGTFTTAYDANGRPVSVAAPGGVSVSSSYDGMGRLIGQAGSGAEAVTAARSFGYDLAGNMTSASAPGGTDTFGFNDRGLLLSASGPSGSSSFS